MRIRNIILGKAKKGSFKFIQYNTVF